MPTDTYHFNPFAGDRQSVEAYLRSVQRSADTQSGDDDTVPCHPFHNSQNRQLLRLLKNGRIQEENIQGKESTFLDTVSVNEAVAQVVTNMERYSTHLGQILNYEINVVSAGQSLEVPFSPQTIQLFCVTKKIGTYFDLVVHAKKNNENDWRSVNYSQTSHPGTGFRHSGDVGSLLHHVKFLADMPNDSVALATVVGYEMIPLRQFTNQLPTVLLVDHEAKILHLVPCPLDERTLGNNTMGVLCGFRRKRDILEVHALESPEGLANKDTSDIDELVQNMATVAETRVVSGIEMTKQTHLRNAARTAQQNVQRGTASVADAFALLGGYSEEKKDFMDDIESEQASVPQLSQYTVIESKLNCTRILLLGNHLKKDSMAVVSTGAGMVRVTSDTITNTEIKTDPSGVDLPIGFSSVFSGSPALALGSPAQGFPGGFTASMFNKMLDDKTGLLVAHISGKGSEKTLLDAEYRANAIFILHVDAVRSDKINAEFLDEVDITGFTCRRGPCSTLLVQSTDGRRFFYSTGSLVPGLFLHVPKYGDDVTEAMSDEAIRSAAVAFAADPSRRPFPNLVPKSHITGPLDDRIVYVGSQPMTLVEFENYLSTEITIEGLENEMDDLSCALTQVASMLSTSELKPMRERLTKALQTIVERHTLPLKAKKEELLRLLRDSVTSGEYDTLVTSADAAEARKKIVADLKAASRFAGRVLTPLVEKIAGMVSVMKSSRRKLDLARIAKLDKMRGNMETIENMDWETLSDRLYSICGEAGFTFVTVDPSINKEMLTSVAEGRFISTTLLSVPIPEVVRIDRRLGGSLDVCTATCLSEVVMNQRHDLAGPMQCISIPATGSGGASNVGLPLLDMDILLQDPADVFWPSTPEGEGGCNDPDRALTRYLVRQIFISSERARSLNMDKHAGSVELSYYCAHFVMSAIERLVASLSDASYPSIPGPSSPQFLDNTRGVLRGLYGLMLSFLASGADPASNVWCVVQRGSKMPLPKAGKGEWVLMARFITCFPHTCWPVKTVNWNSTVLITRLVKAISDAFLQPMRDSLAETKKLEADEFFKRRNHDLFVSYFVSSFIRRYETDPPSIEIIKQVVPEFLKKFGRGSETEGRAELNNRHTSLKPHHHGIVLMLDKLVKFLDTESIPEKDWKFVVGVAKCSWSKHTTHFWHVPSFDGPHQRAIRDEFKAVVATWESQLEEMIDWEVLGDDENQANDGENITVVDSAPVKTQLMSAIENKPGNERGALAVAQMIERDGSVDVKSLLTAYNRSMATAAGTSVRAPAVCSILDYLGYVTPESQGQLIAELLRVFLVGWRGNSDAVWDQAMKVWN